MRRYTTDNENRLMQTQPKRPVCTRSPPGENGHRQRLHNQSREITEGRSVQLSVQSPPELKTRHCCAHKLYCKLYSCCYSRHLSYKVFNKSVILLFDYIPSNILHISRSVPVVIGYHVTPYRNRQRTCSSGRVSSCDVRRPVDA